MGLGLLGALQGAGKGISQFGNALFTEEMEKQRRKELEKIRESDYRRARADQLTDQQTGFDRQDTLIDRQNIRDDRVRTENREYDAGLLTDANALYDERLLTANDLADDRYTRAREDAVEDSRNIITSVQVDDTGTAFGITATGDMREIGDIAKVNPVLSDAMDAYSDLSRQIIYEGLDEQNSPEVFKRLSGYSNIIDRALRDSADKFGLGAPPELNYEQIEALGASLFSGDSQVDLDGNMVSGEQLRGLQEGYRVSYPALYRSYTGQ